MIVFQKPIIQRKDMESVLQALLNYRLGPGESCTALLQSFCETTGCKKALGYRTYPLCIEDALILLGAVENTKIAISPLAPEIYLSVIKKLNCIPVFVDVDREHGLCSQDAVAQSGASIVVLYESCGSLPIKYSVETSSLEKVDYKDVAVLEDISQSIGGKTEEGVCAGSWGDVLICSCEENDIVSCGGGAILGASEKYSAALKDIKRKKYEQMTDVNASLGLIQHGRLAETNSKRREISANFEKALIGSKNKKFGLTNTDFRGSCQSFPVFLDSKIDNAVKFAQKYGVPVKLTFKDCAGSLYEGDIFDAFPVAATYMSRTVSFPLYPSLKHEEKEIIEKVIGHIP